MISSLTPFGGLIAVRLCDGEQTPGWRRNRSANAEDPRVNALNGSRNNCSDYPHGETAAVELDEVHGGLFSWLGRLEREQFT